ncbi:MAG: MFS transporter [Anaerovoracaceae bacterium]|jgi:PPP family 3-phenylpropionic acid transporter
MDKLLNLEYGAVFGIYWMLYAVFFSFSSVFLLPLGYSNSEIGFIMSLSSVLAFFLEAPLADLADRSKRFTLTRITEIMTVLIMILSLEMFFVKGRSLVLFVFYIIFLALHTAMQPLFNALNFKLERCGAHVNFGACRSAGSLMYSAASAVLGTVVAAVGTTVIPISGEAGCALLIVSLVLVSRQYRKILAKNGGEERVEEKKESETIGLALFVKRNKLFFVLNLGVLLMFFFNQVLNGFALQILQNVGGGSRELGTTLALLAFLEIPTMFAYDWLNKKFSNTFLVRVGAVGFTLKAVTVWLARTPWVIEAAQGFSLIAFGLFLPAIVHYINEIMDEGEAVKGQALYAMMTMIATVISSAVGGVILDVSGAGMLLMITAILSICGTVVVLLTAGRVRDQKLAARS